MLETPSGDLIPESAVVAQFGIDYNLGKHMKLWPSEGDPGDVEAAKQSA